MPRLLRRAASDSSIPFELHAALNLASQRVTDDTVPWQHARGPSARSARERVASPRSVVSKARLDAVLPAFHLKHALRSER